MGRRDGFITAGTNPFSLPFCAVSVPNGTFSWLWVKGLFCFKASDLKTLNRGIEINLQCLFAAKWTSAANSASPPIPSLQLLARSRHPPSAVAGQGERERALSFFTSPRFLKIFSIHLYGGTSWPSRYSVSRSCPWTAGVSKRSNPRPVLWEKQARSRQQHRMSSVASQLAVGGSTGPLGRTCNIGGPIRQSAERGETSAETLGGQQHRARLPNVEASLLLPISRRHSTHPLRRWSLVITKRTPSPQNWSE